MHCVLERLAAAWFSGGFVVWSEYLALGTSTEVGYHLHTIVFEKRKSTFCQIDSTIFLFLPYKSGKKAVKAVLWVSADGLRVVDEKTKVRSSRF